MCRDGEGRGRDSPITPEALLRQIFLCFTIIEQFLAVEIIGTKSLFIFSFSFSFFGCPAAYGVLRPGMRAKPSHGWDLCSMAVTPDPLTYCTRLGIEPVSWCCRHPWVHCAIVETPQLIFWEEPTLLRLRGLQRSSKKYTFPVLMFLKLSLRMSLSAEFQVQVSIRECRSWGPLSTHKGIN